MKNVIRTMIVVVFIAMLGVIGVGGYMFMNTQEVVKSQKAQIEELTQQNVKDSDELQDAKEELKDLKDNNVYNEDGTFNAKVYGKDGKEYMIMSQKGILGNVKTVIVAWNEK